MKKYYFLFLFLIGCEFPNKNDELVKNKTRTVEYKVIGNGTSSAGLTYNNKSDDTEQIDPAVLPWSYKFNASNDNFFCYISAQNNNASGSITTQIFINGNKVKETTSTGGYVIATCSGMLGSLSP